MNKHSPAPWNYVVTGSNNSGAIKSGGRGIAAIASSITRDREENLANLKLIAAAPELALALKAASDYFNRLANPILGVTEDNKQAVVLLISKALAKVDA